MRHGPDFYDCIAVRHGDSAVRVHLPVDDQGLAPGQFAVFYDKDTKECLGSGSILQSEQQTIDSLFGISSDSSKHQSGFLSGFTS